VIPKRELIDLRSECQLDLAVIELPPRPGQASIPAGGVKPKQPRIATERNPKPQPAGAALRDRHWSTRFGLRPIKESRAN
jgi:hypothetical protein